MEQPKRGLAALSPERRREIAAMGGRAAQRAGVSHSFSYEEAVAAGRKGGQSLSRDRAHMAEIGRRGGYAKARRNGVAPTDLVPDDDQGDVSGV